MGNGFGLLEKRKNREKNKLNHVVGAATIANCYFEPTCRIYRRIHWATLFDTGFFVVALFGKKIEEEEEKSRR